MFNVNPFQTQIKNLKKHLRVILFTCQQFSWYFSVTTKRIVYLYLMQICFDYGISLYYLALANILKKLKSILERTYKALFENTTKEMLGVREINLMAVFAGLNRFYFNDEFRNLR